MMLPYNHQKSLLSPLIMLPNLASGGTLGQRPQAPGSNTSAAAKPVADASCTSKFAAVAQSIGPKQAKGNVILEVI